MNLLIWGAGEVGGRVGERAARAGASVVAVTATSHRSAQLRARGMEPLRAEDALSSLDLQRFDAVLLAVAGSDGQAEAARRLGGRVSGRVVLASSTAVYGDCSGELGEDGPYGSGERAVAARAAEEAAARMGAVIVRLGGLFSADRGPAAAFARTGRAPPGPSGRTLALIHRDDAVSCLYAALLHPSPRPVYIAVAPILPTRASFYEALAARLSRPAPPLEAGGSPCRYNTDGLRADLLPAPEFPDWRAALDLDPPG